MVNCGLSRHQKLVPDRKLKLTHGGVFGDPLQSALRQICDFCRSSPFLLSEQSVCDEIVVPV